MQAVPYIIPHSTWHRMLASPHGVFLEICMVELKLPRHIAIIIVIKVRSSKG